MSFSNVSDSDDKSGLRFYPDCLPEIIGDSKYASSLDITEIKKVLSDADLEDNIQDEKFYEFEEEHTDI